MPRRKKSTYKKPLKTDNGIDYAFLSIALGAGALFSFLLTALPAIVTGVIALKRKSGNPTQAKIGIALGIISPIIAAALVGGIIFVAMKVSAPLVEEQNAIPKTAEQQLEQTASKLKQYRVAHGSFPQCRTSNKSDSCTEWNDFVKEYGVTLPAPVVFAEGATYFSDKTERVVYATKTMCFINGPVSPGFLSEEEASEEELSRHAALVYYYGDGKGCFAASADERG